LKHKIAIVGSGPAGFYAAEELIQSCVNCSIDIIEKLPTPYGLVRSGVAPDHPEVKVRVTIPLAAIFHLIFNQSKA
jgi:NADPH-dependent glutamate synthase beta subunit-like oxidoreductase